MDIGQPEVTALVLECQTLVIDTQAVQGRRLQVVYVNRMLDHVVAIVVGLSVRDSRRDASARHPHREAPRVVISAVVRFAQLPWQ